MFISFLFSFQQAATQISNNGIKFIVEDAKSFQAAAYITKDCFSEFKLAPSDPPSDNDGEESPDDDIVAFGLNLKMFTECLSMFLNMEYNSSMRMMYKGEGMRLNWYLSKYMYSIIYFPYLYRCPSGCCSRTPRR